MSFVFCEVVDYRYTMTLLKCELVLGHFKLKKMKGFILEAFASLGSLEQVFMSMYSHLSTTPLLYEKFNTLDLRQSPA